MFTTEVLKCYINKLWKIRYRILLKIQELSEVNSSGQMHAYVLSMQYIGHSVSNQQGILDHLLDFDETWCVCSSYGAHHPYQFLTT